MTPTSIVAYLVLFGTAAFSFVLASLILGHFVRPSAPTPEKLEAYECGEPPVGSGFLQFDFRFYVVALVFIIFEVEMAFFFPWAAVFGKLTRLGDPQTSREATVATYSQLGVPQTSHHGHSGAKAEAAGAVLTDEDLRHLTLAAMADIALFFAILLVGFAYVWNRGDLNWVRAARLMPVAGTAEPTT